MTGAPSAPPGRYLSHPSPTLPSVKRNRYEYAGALLREAREAAGLDRPALAAGIDRSPELITLYELNYRRPPPEVLVAIAAVLGVHVETFFVETDPAAEPAPR